MTTRSTVQKLSDLREPPIPGRFYLVPVISYTYCGNKGDWPVLGPLHTDREHFNFPDPHYHVDPRFLTAQQVERVTRHYAYWNHSIEAITGGAPLCDRRTPLPKGRPALKRRKCRSVQIVYAHGSRPQVLGLRADYPDPAQPIRKPDGRLLCPHRKVDLSSLVPDADGIVTCPLYGLRVACGRHG